MIAETLPDGHTATFAYDAAGNPTAITPPGRPAHDFSYTPVDLISAYIPPEVAGAGLNQTAYAYNLDRQLTRATRPDALLVDLGYDAAGRLSALALPDGQVGRSYDPATGKLAQVTAPDGGTLKFTYTGALRTGATWAGAVAGQVGYSYDNDLRLSTVSVNGANPITFGYDADSLLTQAGALTLTRNAQNGLLTGSTLGKVTDSLAYNGFAEPTSYSVSVSGTPVFAVSYTRDKLGRITRRQETVGGVTTTYDYVYDLAGQLSTVSQNGALAAGYTYDSNGNRLTRSTPSGIVNGSYDDQDRLLQYGSSTYTYAANGELASKTTGGQTTQYLRCAR